MNNPLLTITIPTTIDRRHLFYPLWLELSTQIYDNRLLHLVELIHEEDDKTMPVGAKRQLLLERARGKFVIGFDSDDWPAESYVFAITQAIYNNPDADHIGFYESCSFNGTNEKRSIFSIRYQKWQEDVDGMHVRCANPKSAILREKALQVGFAPERFGEDRVFSEAVTPLLANEIFIDQDLYYYRYNEEPHDVKYGFDKELDYKPLSQSA